MAKECKDRSREDPSPLLTSKTKAEHQFLVIATDLNKIALRVGFKDLRQMNDLVEMR